MGHFLLPTTVGTGTGTTVLNTATRIHRPKIRNNISIYLLASVQIIPDPDPGKSSGSDRIRIQETELKGEPRNRAVRVRIFPFSIK